MDIFDATSDALADGVPGLELLMQGCWIAVDGVATTVTRELEEIESGLGEGAAG